MQEQGRSTYPNYREEATFLRDLATSHARDAGTMLLSRTRRRVRLPECVKSPLTGNDAPLRLRIPSASIIKLYRERYAYDARRYFFNVPEVGVYECDTGFSFHYPFSLTGDESLYRQLETFEWTNDKEDKWEYRAALPHIRVGDKVLDVGCGEGHFLVKARDQGATAFGIELNRNAARIAQSMGVHVHEELLHDHGRTEFYDVVTAFQVLEHVADPLPPSSMDASGFFVFVEL